MESSNLFDLIDSSPKGVSKKELVDDRDLGVKLLNLATNQSLPPHATPATALFYVLSGEGIIQVENEERALGPGTLVKTDPKVKHGIRNTGTQTLSILLVQGPNPFFCC